MDEYFVSVLAFFFKQNDKKIDESHNLLIYKLL